jgi:hypothetical protein
VTTAKIKNGAVTGAKVKSGSLTGTQINASTLGTVPNATNATNATNAGNANTVNGQTATKIFRTLTPGEKGVVVATISGFTFKASCEKTEASASLTAPSSAGTVLIAEGNGENLATATSIFEYASSKAGETSTISLSEGRSGTATVQNTYGESSFSGATSTGTVISGELGFDYGTFNEEAPERCVVFGQVTSG